MSKNSREIYDKNIEITNIGDLCTDVMKIFGANTNLMRHLPTMVDGLKPGERRVLYTMYLSKSMHNANFRKVATIVGETLSLHPHGEAPVGETIVKLGQPWSNIQCLIDSQGNFGSAKGETSAATRYIAARLSYYAYKCFFEEFDTSIVDMKPNYSGTLMEPEYLPSKYPNVLINNTFGIGYGISTGLPTYNLKEVLNLTIKLLEDPSYNKCTLYPDSPTGAYIIDEGQFDEISKTGKGKFKMRGCIEVDEKENALIIRNAPFQTSLQDAKIDILDLFESNKIRGFKDIRDNSDNKKIEIVIYLKKEVDPYVIMHTIYTKTSLEKTFPVNFKLIDDYTDTDYNIKDLILSWLDFRRETKRIIFNHKLLKVKERQHILEILIFILNKDNAEKTLSIVKKSENKKEMVERLMKAYGITSLQASTIADMRMTAFSKESYRKYKDEKDSIDDDVKKFEKIAKSNKKIDKIIKEELEEGIKLFGTERKSKIITINNELKIRDTDHLMIFTLNGFVKKLPHDTTSIGFINQGDYPVEIINARNITDLLIFDKQGVISKLPVHKLTNVTMESEGEKLSSFITVRGGITTIIPKPTQDALDVLKVPVYLLMITANGTIKKTLANQYINIRNELTGIVTKDNDVLVAVKLLAGDKDVVIYTNKGMGVRISSKDIKETSRMSMGIKSISMTEGECVIGMDIVNEKDKYLLCLTNKGNCKKSPLATFKTMDRASKPLKIITIDNGEEVLFIKTVKGKEKFKAYLKTNVEIIDVENVVELPRLSKGKKLIPVKKGDVIIDIKEIK